VRRRRGSASLRVSISVRLRGPGGSHVQPDPHTCPTGGRINSQEIGEQAFGRTRRKWGKRGQN